MGTARNITNKTVNEIDPDLNSAIDRLASTCREVQSDAEFSFAPVDRDELNGVTERLPLSSDLLQWYEYNAPHTFWFWWGNQFYLHDPRTLRSAQCGYRWNQHEIEFENNDWNPNWVVIGDWGGDPVIAHTDEPGTPISMDIHGGGEWAPKKIAPDLQSFIMGISVWLDIFFVRWNGQYQTEDCSIRPEVIEEFNREIRTVLGEEFARYWPWGTAY